jgi:N-acetylmuramoyl-L-alanine amidase
VRRAVHVLNAAVAAVFLVLAALPVSAQGFGALARVVAEDTRAETRGEVLTLRLGLSQPVPFRVFALDDPWRVVVDFREVAWDGVPTDFSGLPGVASVDVGAAVAPGWSRMVLSLDRPMLPSVAAMRTDPGTGRAVVELTLEPVQDAEFRARAGGPEAIAATAIAPPADNATPGTGRTIVVLDPGHGGVDPGAVRGDHTEADLVLTFARELAEALRRTGRIDVVLTREADVFVPLPTRVTLARAAGADALISIHADALAEGRARGATLYTLADTASDEAGAALAEQHDRADLLQGIDLSSADDVVAGVLMDLARVETAPRGVALADGLVASIDGAGLRLHRRPRGEAGFTVLRAADIPSVLLEIGFMSDRGDLENILDPDWRAALQAAIVAGILDWVDEDAMRATLLRQ